MRTLVSLGFLVFAGVLTDFVWSQPLSGVPMLVSCAGLAAFVFGLAAVAVAPALDRGDWRMATGYGLVFGAMFGGAVFGVDVYLAPAPILGATPLEIGALTVLSAAYSLFSYALTSLVLGCAVCDLEPEGLDADAVAVADAA